MKVNKRTSAVTFSATLALDTRAKQMIASGIDVINMAVGQPDFPAPISVQEAAIAKIASGQVGYTPVAGTPGLRQAAADFMTRTRGIPFEPEQISVCHSTKHALAAVLMTLVEPGDEVLLFEPVWNSYEELVRFAGGVPVGVPPRADCGPDFDAMREKIGPRTRGMMLNSPSNPSGYVWTEEEIREVSSPANEHDMWILSDEIYQRLVYEGPPSFSPAAVDAETRARTVIADGASKCFAMTGYRIGFIAAPTEIASAVARQNSQVTGCPNAISQAGLEAALRDEPPEVEAMVAEFAARRTLIIDGLRALGLTVPQPRGAFYAFPDVSQYLDDRGSAGFCADLLETEALAIVPGAVFGLDTHVRFSYATSRELILAALERFGRFLATRS
ncbi:MAG: aspartate aminotransferase [Planctomycetota bacterium]|jgi:aspartate aminotransferase